VEHKTSSKREKNSELINIKVQTVTKWHFNGIEDHDNELLLFFNYGFKYQRYGDVENYG
jgi:hypothetical protein